MLFVQFLGVVRDFEDEEFPPVNVDDFKSPSRKSKELVKTSQTATRKVLQTSYAADSSWSEDLLPNGCDEVYPTSHSAKGRSIDQPRPATQALRGQAPSHVDHFRRKDPSSSGEDDSRSLSKWRGGRRSVVCADNGSLSDGRLIKKSSTTTTTTTTDNDNIDAIFPGAGATAVAELR